MTALQQFGAELLRLSRGLEAAADPARTRAAAGTSAHATQHYKSSDHLTPGSISASSGSPSSAMQDAVRRRSAQLSHAPPCHGDHTPRKLSRRSSKVDKQRSMSDDEGQADHFLVPNNLNLKSRSSEDSFPLPPPCTCPYFGENPSLSTAALLQRPTEVIIVPSETIERARHGFKESLQTRPRIPKLKSDTHLANMECTPPLARRPSQKNVSSMVTWEENRRFRRGSSFGSARTSIVSLGSGRSFQQRRTATLRLQNGLGNQTREKNSASASLLQRPSSTHGAIIRSHHSRNSSVVSRNSSRHGRILRLEQKATKVLGVVFFTFVFLWAPFFIINMVLGFCPECEDNISPWVFDSVTWLGYASSMLNPIFYTIFNKVFRQAFKKVLMCQYCRKNFRQPQR